MFQFLDVVKEDSDLFVYSAQFDNYFRNSNFDNSFKNFDEIIAEYMTAVNFIKLCIIDGSISKTWASKELEVDNIIYNTLLSLTQHILFNMKHLNEKYDSKINDIELLIGFFLRGLKP
ncbi:MAG: hypothetical protein HUJ61_05880 [Bacilli bacterium]|nr:hypothetical protein [Bacilli bacterium]